jgi:hypothetical protein
MIAYQTIALGGSSARERRNIVTISNKSLEFKILLLVIHLQKVDVRK